MHITQIFTLTAILAAGVLASPTKPSRPAPPSPKTQQTVSCGNDAAPYCCNNEDSVTLVFVGCTALAASGNCNGITVCCNNNSGQQQCST